MSCHPLVTAYLWLVRHTKSRDGRLLPLALATAGGCFEGAVGRWPNASKDRPSVVDQKTREMEIADAMFCDWMARLSLPVARRLADLEAADPSYCRALGIGSKEDLLLCIAIVLYLRPEDALLGDLVQPLSGRVQASVAAARREILRILKKLLSREPGAAAIALDRTRGSVAVQSHYAREILLLTLGAMGRQPLTTPDRLEIQALWDELGKRLVPPSVPTACEQLARAVILALQADLKWVARHGQWMGWGHAASNRPVPDLDLDRQRDPSSLAEDVPLTGGGRTETLWDDADADDPPEDSDAADPQDADSPAAWEQDQASADGLEEDWPEPPPDLRDPAAPADTVAELERYAEVLLRIVEAFESAPAKVTCGRTTTSLAHYAHFRYAAQLLSFFSAKSYRVSDRAALVNALSPIFAGDRTDPFGIFAAIAVYRNCPGNSRWGESDDGARNAVITQVVAAYNRDLAAKAQKEARETRQGVIDGMVKLAELNPKNPACDISIEIDAGRLTDDPGGVALEYWFETVAILVSRDRSARLRRYWPGGLTQLENLRANLERLMDLDAARALQAMVEAMHREFGCVAPPLTTAEERAQLSTVLDHWFQRQRTASGDIGLLWPWMRDLVTRLIRNLPPEPAEPPSVNTAMVKGFFRQLHARNVDARTVATWTRNNWEFLAYRIAFPKRQTDAPIYGEIYRIVANSAPLPSNHWLHGFYRSLPVRQQVLARLKAAIDDCCSSANGAHHP
jgi:hypothetical protein